MVRIDDQQKMWMKLRRERRLKRALSLISWGLAMTSLAGLFRIYNTVSATPIVKAGSLTSSSPHTGDGAAAISMAQPSSPPGTRSVQPALQLGSQGDSVRRLQQDLAKLGFFMLGYFTDYYGPMTERAVRRFQAHYGLAATGEADPITVEKIHSLANALPDTTLSSGSDQSGQHPAERAARESHRTQPTVQGDAPSPSQRASQPAPYAIPQQTQPVPQPFIVTRGS